MTYWLVCRLRGSISLPGVIEATEKQLGSMKFSVISSRPPAVVWARKYEQT